MEFCEEIFCNVVFFDFFLYLRILKKSKIIAKKYKLINYKHMKTRIFKMLLIAFALTFAVSAFAQEAPQRKQKTVEEMAAVQTEAMATRLALTPEQTKRIMEINLDFVAKKKEAKDRNAPEEEFVLLYKNREDAVKSVLTSEQFANWKKDPLEEMRERREQRETGTKNESKSK